VFFRQQRHERPPQNAGRADDCNLHLQNPFRFRSIQTQVGGAFKRAIAPLIEKRCGLFTFVRGFVTLWGGS
jgi:hypothetical protein